VRLRKEEDPQEQVWNDVGKLVRCVGDGAVGRFDPATGQARLSAQFELLVSAGLHQSSDFQVLRWHLLESRYGAKSARAELGEWARDAHRRRIRDLTAGVVRLKMLLEVTEEPTKRELIEGTGGYLDLLARWLGARAAVLAFLYRRAEGSTDFERPGIEESGNLEDEALLLAQLLTGTDNPVPKEHGFPGGFVWLASSHGPADALYRDWR